MVAFSIHNLNFNGPLLWIGFNCLKATEPLWGGSLLFTSKFPEISGTHLINLRRMKGWVNFFRKSPHQNLCPSWGTPSPTWKWSLPPIWETSIPPHWKMKPPSRKWFLEKNLEISETVELFLWLTNKRHLALFTPSPLRFLKEYLITRKLMSLHSWNLQISKIFK